MKIGKGTAFTLAVLIHLAIIVALVVNVSLDKPERPQNPGANLMHATMITPPAKGNPNGKIQGNTASKEKDKQKEESIKQDDAKKEQAQKELLERVEKQQAEERKRQQIVEQKKKAEIARKEEERRLLALKKAEEQKKLEEKKKLEEQKKLEEKKKLEEQKKLEEKKKLEEQKKLEEKKKLEEQKKLEEKKKAEAEAKRKADEDAKRKAQANALEDDILGLEDGDEINGQGLGSGGGDGGYGSKIQGLIEQNWLIDPSMNGKTVKFMVKIDNNGNILSRDCQGDKKVCRSAEAAIDKIGLFPKPPVNCPECGNIVISMTPKL